MTEPASDIVTHLLCDRPEFVEIVGQWHWDEWDHAIADRTLASTIDWVRTIANRDRLPLTLVATIADQPVGAVTAVVGDMEAHPDLAPWIIGVVTDPGYRRRGIGRALMLAIVELIGAMGTPRLYLYTDAIGAGRQLYEGLGWQTIAEETYKDVPVVVMSIATEPNAKEAR